MADPFTFRAGLESGLTRGELRSRRLNREIHGVRSTKPDLALIDRCQMLGLRLSDAAIFSHVTAALLHGFPLPWLLERSTPVHVTMPAPARALHCQGVEGHELDVSPGDIATLGSIRVTSPARTWCDLAATLSLPDLVAAGDYVIQRQLPLASVTELGRMAKHFAGRRGATVMRLAIPLLEDRSESRPESILRVIIVLAGLPAPLINHTMIDTETGRAMRPDFTFSASKTILEYQGDYHRSANQWRKDMTRRSRLESKGWKVMELNWDDLQDPDELVCRIRALLAR